jgi:uncharacterized RDD family membrane protein YckC
MRTSHLFIRVVAAVMDSLLVCLLWYYFIDIWSHADSGGSLTSSTFGGNKVVTGTPALVLMFFTASYWMIPEWILGATLGKLTLGLRVKTIAGQPISLSQSFNAIFYEASTFFLFT